jgi:thymidine kinase
MSKILSFADKINKLTAICSICHKEACMTQRLIKGKPAKYTDPIILIDDKSFHCPRCRKHHKVLNNPNKIKL